MGFYGDLIVFDGDLVVIQRDLMLTMMNNGS